MNTFLHKFVVLARTIPPFHESHAVWRTPRDGAWKPSGAANGRCTGHVAAPRKWTIAGLR